MAKRKTPICPYCGNHARLLDKSGAVYGGRDFGPVWACLSCRAWVGCHPGTTVPLGRLADAELRRAKMAAHRAFDDLWRRKMKRDGCRKGEARGAGYRWLAGQLGLPAERTHIGMFDVETCRRVVEVCRPYRRGR